MNLRGLSYLPCHPPNWKQDRLGFSSSFVTVPISWTFIIIAWTADIVHIQNDNKKTKGIYFPLILFNISKKYIFFSLYIIVYTLKIALIPVSACAVIS